MTKEQIEEQIRVIRSATKKACKNKKTALKFLRDAGILKDKKKYKMKKEFDAY